MCNFFSFLTDGNRRIYYFDGNQRRRHVTFRDGQSVPSYDSHTSIARFYGLNEDDWSKGEYNPFTDKLVLDQQNTTWDENKVRGMLSDVDWHTICGDLEGARAFLRELREIPWFRPDGTLKDGDGIRVFETKEAAWNAARNAARSAARDAARSAAWDAARDAARDAAWDAAWNAAWSAAWDAARAAAWDAARDATRDAARDAALYICVSYVCSGLPINPKHIDHIRKRMDVWRHGYGVLCDVDGVLYCYERV